MESEKKVKDNQLCKMLLVSFCGLLENHTKTKRSHVAIRSNQS